MAVRGPEVVIYTVNLFETLFSTPESIRDFTFFTIANDSIAKGSETFLVCGFLTLLLVSNINCPAAI